MTDVFISYKREERATARMLADALIAQGFHVWWDADMPPGEKYRDYTLKILQSCRAAFVIWSPLSMKSGWVLDEAQRAMDRDVLIPVFLEPIGKVPLGFGQLHTHDLTGWTGDANATAFQPVIAALRRLIGPAPRPSEGSDTEVVFWRGIQDSKNPADLEAYLAAYGDGVFAPLAQRRLDDLRHTSPPRGQSFAPSWTKGAWAPFTRWELGFIAAAAFVASFLLWPIANLVLGAQAFYLDDLTGLLSFDRLYNVFLLVPLLVGLAWLWDRGAAAWSLRGQWPSLPRYALLGLLAVGFFLSLRMLENAGRETHFVLWLGATWAAAVAARSATSWLRSRAGSAL